MVEEDLPRRSLEIVPSVGLGIGKSARQLPRVPTIFGPVTLGIQSGSWEFYSWPCIPCLSGPPGVVQYGADLKRFSRYSVPKPPNN